MNKPNIKPKNPNFSSGPCPKRPGWDISVLKNSQTGRSHRSKECKKKLKEVIVKSKQVLKLPDSYNLAIMPGSNTGALESAMWSLLGYKDVDVLAWENFGSDWAIDVLEQLKIGNVNSHKADYGKLPDLSKVNFSNDVIFVWNGTTSGVCVPDAKWIPANREGLTICDATSAIFAMDIDFNKLDVITWSWQKVLGGEAAHGMLALSPRALKRLETYTPRWPIPKLFRISNNKKLIKGIFEGSTINTPSMICVEDVLDSLNWVESIGGTDELKKISNKNLQIVTDWVNNSDWIEFMCSEPKTRSSTSITLQIKDEWFNQFSEDEQKDLIKKIVSQLYEENVVHDINSYPKAPPSLRLWGGPTVNNDDMKMLLPWIDWAYKNVRN
ncbi:MAG: phosphoserine transaminase [Pelagibacteraceae bacterium]|jgi:phosphoserine aminotransferase|nr:phosphoserine transaminase [Pelagibacteraceae bacterium]